MSVDVVIVTYNSATDLQACIRAVRRWSHAGRIVVVDNGSTDDSGAVASSLADEVVCLDVNRGYGAGQNRGVAETTSEWVLLLNPDAEVRPDALDAGLATAQADPRVAMVEGEIRRSSDSRPERWSGSEPGLRALTARLLRLRERLGEERLQWLAGITGVTDYRERTVRTATRVEFLAAVAPLVRRRAFDAVGGFDESFFLYAEDIDLGRRLRDAGWELLAIPEPWATHIGGASSAGRSRWRDRMWWASHRRLVTKHWSGPRRWVGIVLTTLGAAFQGGPRGGG